MPALIEMEHPVALPTVYVYLCRISPLCPWKVLFLVILTDYGRVTSPRRQQLLISSGRARGRLISSFWLHPPLEVNIQQELILGNENTGLAAAAISAV